MSTVDSGVRCACIISQKVVLLCESNDGSFVIAQLVGQLNHNEPRHMCESLAPPHRCHVMTPFHNVCGGKISVDTLTPIGTYRTMELLSFNIAGFRLRMTLFLLFLAGCVALTLLLYFNFGIPNDEDGTTRPVVTIPQGTAQGVIMMTKNNRSVAGFLGIPFGKPPVADLRFKAPVAAEAWEGILDAGNESPVCIQMWKVSTLGSEDCLYLNVYTPKIPTTSDSRLLPVMVWIHGGAFSASVNNSTLYGPTFLLDKDILLVVPNYRLGALGFLSTGDAVAPGNWGLKDQILALKWIQKNIKYFGGDPDQVTLAGDSAGSMSTEILALSKAAEGLFHRYICQSGVTTSPLVCQGEPIKRAIELGKHLGCPTNSSALLLQCLRKADASKIIGASPIFLKWAPFPFASWLPAVEPDIEGAVLTDTPANLLTRGRIRDLPAMAGSVRDDGFLMSAHFHLNPDQFEVFLNDFDHLAPYVFSYYDKSKNESVITSALKSFYFNNDLTANRTKLLANFTVLVGDNLRFPSFREVQQASANSSPWYSYSFEYRGTLGYSYFFTGSLSYGSIVCHEDDLLYLFSQEKSDYFKALNETLSDTDIKMVDRMVELWTSFVITGVPHSTALGNASWPRFSTSEQYLRIGNGADPSLQVHVRNSSTADRAKFWKAMTKNYW